MMLLEAVARVGRLRQRWDAIVAEHGIEAAQAVRRRIAELDPLTFALVYLPKHLTGNDGRITLSSVHEGWIDYAMTWGEPTTAAEAPRDAFVAPRDMGKSTWFFLLLPMWAAASGRIRFAAAFADSAAQAETHLSTFKRELDENARLREDYPDLCAPATRPRGTTVSDNRAMLQTRAGFVFAARGIDSSNLGMKVGADRPDLLILDDVEPGESNYSAYQVTKRLGTIIDVVLPLNGAARVCLVGTVTMPGSIVHQLVAPELQAEEPAWIRDERFKVHHSLPFDDQGESVWPERWSTEYLRSIEHTRSFAKNFLNEPMPTDGDYWQPETFRYGTLAGITRQLLSVDPAVTTRTTSDFTGLAVVGLSPSAKKCLVRHVEQVKLAGDPLRQRALTLLEQYPDTTHLLVEVNQGGDLWLQVFHDMPVPVVLKSSTGSKEVRAAETLNHYQRGRVLHERRFVEAEQQLAAFPKAAHDDMVDAIGNAVNRLLRPAKRRTEASARTTSY